MDRNSFAMTLRPHATYTFRQLMENPVTTPISGISHVRLSAPDLGRMQAFLEDFGMIEVHRDAKTLYMRGIGTDPFIHVTELGAPGVKSFAYKLQDDSLLTDLARLPGAHGRGDARFARRRASACGCRTRMVCGSSCWRAVQAAEPPCRRAARMRSADGAEPRRRPARVNRLAHTAYKSAKLAETIAWYRANLRLLPTDELYIDTPDNLLGQFLRVDAGEQPVDHHVLFLLRGPKRGHAPRSFEMESVDDLFSGFDQMTHKSHDHIRGIGRHALGSQIFNYWMSPFEQMHEHWISNEKMNAHSKFNSIRIGEGMSHDSGEKPSERFVKQVSPVIGWTA
jgi:catechol 2,3-dioxygenase-like lactoylglutathione lyase family enzyme